MSSQPMLLNMRSQKPVQKIEQPKPDVSIETEHPKITIQSTLPKVTIDQKKAFSESGLKGVLELALENAKSGMNIMIQKIGRIIDEGNQMANIQDGVDVVAENADENAFGQFSTELNIGTMPMSGPEINVIEGKNDIRVNEGKVDINVKINKPIHNYQAGKVEIYVKQFNRLNITVVGDQLDIRI